MTDSNNAHELILPTLCRQILKIWDRPQEYEERKKKTVLFLLCPVLLYIFLFILQFSVAIELKNTLSGESLYGRIRSTLLQP